MAFKRASGPVAAIDASTLTAALTSIGFNFASRPSKTPADIETTLVQASRAGVEEGDLRTLSVLTTWLGVHIAHVNVERLVRFVREEPSHRVQAYWSAVAHWLSADRRLSKLLVEGDAVELLPTGTAFQLKRRGADPRFEGSRLLVPAGTLRDRPEDVLSAQELVKLHPGYRNRVLMGSSWRADVWTALELAPTLPASEIARRVSCSFATAWETARDFRLLHPEAAGPSPE